MSTLIKGSFESPDLVKTPDKTHAATVEIGPFNATKLILEPGWKWSDCVKPHVGGESCQAMHVGIVVQGSMTCIHNDGNEISVQEGDAYTFAPGHDGWVTSDVPFIAYEIISSGKDFGAWKKAE